jgi:arylformamidase
MSEIHIVDLSHTLCVDTPFFSGEAAVRVSILESADGGLHPSGRRSLNCSRLDTNVHCGTHMDSPFHFYNEGVTIDQIPLSTCVGPAVLVDLRPLAPREEVRVSHLSGQRELLEETKRVVLRTGWSAEWEHPRYFTDYPVLSGEVADFLVSLGVQLVGVDTPSVDNPPFPAHLSFLGGGVVIVENLTNLDLVPAGKFHLTVAPLKISGRDASPVRAFAQLI